MAKSRVSRKPAASAVAGFTPLALTAAEKGITRAASTALTATTGQINGVSLTLKTPEARMAYWSSLRSWILRNITALAPAAKSAKARGAAA